VGVIVQPADARETPRQRPWSQRRLWAPGTIAADRPTRPAARRRRRV